MTIVLFKNLNGDELGRRHLPPARRKVGTIVRRCARRDVPFIVSVHKPFTPQTPCNNTVATRSAHRTGLEHRSWDRWVPDPEDVVVVTYLPEGGRGGQTALKIASSIAALTLMLVNPALSLGLISAKTATTLQIASALVIGGTSIAMALSRPKSQQPIYGVTGGGNLPRPNSPIPVGYGTCWRVPDLSQPDYSRYENREDTILLKRVVIGQGKYRLKRIRVGTTTFWSGDIEPNGGVVTSGITSPFPGCRFEFIYGQASTLVPSSVISSPNVTGQTIPLSTDPDPILGPFPVNPVNTTINRIQVDFSTPSGYSRNGHETTQDLWFEYAPIDDAGNPTGPWQTLYRTTAPFFANRHLRFSQTITVPDGRYAVRARNNRAKIDDNDNCNYAWDGLRGYVPDIVVREHVTEIAMEIRSSKGLGQTAFADVQVEVERVGLVWNGTAFVEGPIRKCLDCFVDIIRDPHYGLAEQASMIDLAKVHAYKTAVTEFDTFDGFINGPVAAAEAMASVLLPMRAEPTMVGAGYTFTRDEPSPVRRHLFTRRQIVRNSLSLSYKPQADDGSAHFIVQFDDGGDYRRPNSAEKWMGIPSRTPRIVKVPGVSSYQHAHHLATWMAAAGYCRRKTASFRTELDARLISRGDPIGLDVWFVRETKVAGITAFSGTSLTLDVDVDIEAGDHAILRDRKGREWGPVPVSQGASSRNVVLDETACALEEADTGLSLAQVIGSFNADRCSIRIGPPARLGEQFLVRSISNQENLQAQIEAVVDSASVYAELNAPIPPQSPLTWGLLPSESPAILSLTASCERHDSILMVKWSARAEAGADSYEFQIAVGSDDADWQPLASGPSPIGQSPMPYLSTEVACYIRGRAFGSTGVPGNWLVSAPFTTPKPIVVATGAEPGAIDWAAFDADFQERVEQVEADALAALTTADTGLATATDALADAAAAQAAADAAQADALQGLADADVIRRALSPIPEIRGSVSGAMTVPFYALMAEQARVVDFALGKILEADDLLRQATIEVDQASGRVVIRALDKLRTETETQFSQVSATFDAVNAQIELRATQAELAEAITALTNEFTAAYRWEFNGTLEGWSASNLTATEGESTVTITPTGTPAVWTSPPLTLAADDNRSVAVRIRRTAGSGWGVNLEWGSNSRPLLEPTTPGGWNIIRANMTGQPGWAGTLTELRLAFAEGATYEIDFIEIGRSAVQDLVIDDLEGRLSDVEIGLDAANAALSLKATLVDLGAANDRITVAENRLDAAEAAILLRVTTAQREEDLTRLSTAETRLDALDGSYTVTLGQFQTAQDLIAELANAQAASLLGWFNRTQDMDQRLVYASQTLSARINEQGDAIAQQETQLLALTASTGAQFAEIIAVQASDRAAAGSRLEALEAVVSHPLIGPSAIFGRLVAEEQVRASETGALASRVSATEAAIETLEDDVATKASASALDALTTRVDDAEGDITALGTRTSALEVGLEAVEDDLPTRATVAALDTQIARIDANEAGITALGVRADSLEATADDHEGRIANVETVKVDAGQVAATTQASLTARLGGANTPADLLTSIAETMAAILVGSSSREQALAGQLAYVGQLLDARINEQGDAIATDRTTLLALKEATEAAVLQLGQAQATTQSALAALTEVIEARYADAQANIATLQSTKVDAAGATAIAQTEANAAVGDVTANGLFRVAAISAPSGATSAAKLLVKAADSGNYADAGIEMVAIAGGGGSPQGYLVLVGNRIYRRPSGGGAPVLMVDSDGRFVTPALAPGTTRRRQKLTRDNSVSASNIGVGAATGNGVNGWLEHFIGSLEVVANPGVMSGVGSAQGIVEASMRLTVASFSTNGAAKIVSSTPADVRVQFAVIARRASYSDVLVCDPPIDFTAVTAAFSTSVNWRANFPLVVDSGTTVLDAGTWNFYLAWRLKVENIQTIDASLQTIKVTGHCTVTTDRC